MKNKLIFHCIVVLSLLLAALPVQTMQAAPIASAAPADLLQFTAGGHALGFTAEGMYAATGSHALHVDFARANSVRPQVPGQDKAATGTVADGNPDTTQGKAAPLDQVTYANLWDGVSLTYTAEAGSIYTTTYTLAPGVDPAEIRLRYNAPLTLNKNGTLGIAFETGSMSESAPLAWQEINGKRVPVEAAFRVHGQEVSFALGAYDPAFPLTIDPSLVWNSFLGGPVDDDYGYSVAVDTSGSIYVTGSSSTSWEDPVRAYTGGKDAFVAKFFSVGSLSWSTFLGGSGDDSGYGISLGANGTLYVVGESTATWGAAPVRAYTGGTDAFVAKVNAYDGAFIWNTFLGGSGNDEGRGIAVDGSAGVYVVGDSTASWGTSPVRAFAGGTDAYIAKLDGSGALVWNTFLGGNSTDLGRGIALDGNGFFFYVTGSSYTSWSCAAACTVEPYTASYDIFAARLNATNGELVWNSFLGGDGTDYGYGIAVGSRSGFVYLTGISNFSWGTPMRAFTGGWDGFAARLNGFGYLTWNTFLGGDGFDYGNGIAVDADEINVYVTGSTGYSDAAWTCTDSPCTELAYNSGYDAFAAKLGTSRGDLDKNTFLGTSSTDNGNAIAVGADGYVYLAGYSGAAWSCSTFCTTLSYTGGMDGFAVKLDASIELVWNAFSGGGGEDIGYAIAVDTSGNVTVTGSSEASWGSPQRLFISGGDAFVARLNASGTLLWNTFLGARYEDEGHDIVVDGNGNSYVVGWSYRDWSCTSTPCMVRSKSASMDGFAAKLDPSGMLLWNTFLGGDSYDQARSIALDGSGNLYITGNSSGAWSCSYVSDCTVRDYAGTGDAFVVKLNTSGEMLWNSFLGGSGYVEGYGIAVDGNSNVYVTGVSTDTWGAPVLPFTLQEDAFTAKLNPSGVLLWNSFLGSGSNDDALGVVVDGSGNVYVTGYSQAAWGSPVNAFSGPWNGFIARLNSNGGYDWHTFLGGYYSSSNDIALDSKGNVYVTGYSQVAWGSPEVGHAGGDDAFAARFNAASGALTWNTFLGGANYDYGYGIALDPGGDIYMTGKSNSTWGTPARAYAGGYDAIAVKLDPTPPWVVSSLRADANLTNAASVHFTVNFNETVTGVDTADFLLMPSGITGAAISGVSGSGSTYTVTVSTGTGTGTLRLDVVDNDSIQDGKGHPLGGTGTGNGNYSGGESYSIRPPCYALSRAYSGSGSVPTASPTNSNSCAGGQYVAGEVITLTASPTSGWAVGSWVGTNNNSSTSITNSLTMPASDQTVTVNYIQNTFRIYLPLVIR